MIIAIIIIAIDNHNSYYENNGRQPSSSSNFSILVFRACPLIEIRQTAPRRATRDNSISVNSTLPLLKPSLSGCVLLGPPVSQNVDSPRAPKPLGEYGII